LQFTDKIDNSLVDLGHIHRLHGLQIHSRDEISIIIINMHVAWWMIANPSNENVTAASNPAHASKSSESEVVVDSKSLFWPAAKTKRLAALCSPELPAF
jgi:hypothetical protein